MTTLGLHHFAVHNLSIPGKVTTKLGQFGECSELIVCHAQRNSDLLAGTVEGYLQIWRDNLCSFEIKNLKGESIATNNGALVNICCSSAKIFCGFDSGGLVILNTGY